MKQLLILIIVFISTASQLKGQSYDQKPDQADESLITSIANPAIQSITPISFVATPKQAAVDYKPNIKAAKSPNLSKDHSKMRLLKAEAALNKRTGINVEGADGETHSRNTSFEVTNGFYTDLNGGCPNDNTIAISKDGRIISMMNGMVGIYHRNGTHVNSYQLDNFFNNYVTSSCDPKVEYDPNADRFFMFVQSCGEPFDYIAFGFSQTNDPNGRWNIYLFNSDAFGDGSMSDYPKLAITQKEVFVTLRLFDKATSKFKETICYQLDKNDGFTGDQLNYLIWKGLPFSTAPVRSGSGLYGPGAYLIHSESGGSNELTLLDITNNIGANPSITSSSISVPRYEVPASGYQLGSDNPLDSGDSRMQDAYYQNGTIHCVYASSKDQWASIRYHRLNLNQINNSDYVEIHLAGEKDYTYPSITPFTYDTKNQTSLMHFQATGSNSYPEMRAIVFNDDFSFDNSRQIHQGNGSMEYCYDSNRGYARWGDYTEVALDYGANTPKVWVTGSVAYSNNPVWNTFLAELSSDGNVTNTQDASTSEVKLYPNPTSERMNIYIDVAETLEVQFNLYSAQGMLITELFGGSLYSGHNEFSFDVSNLAEGAYFVQIIDQQQNIIKNEKIIIHH